MLMSLVLPGHPPRKPYRGYSCLRRERHQESVRQPGRRPPNRACKSQGFEGTIPQVRMHPLREFIHDLLYPAGARLRRFAPAACGRTGGRRALRSEPRCEPLGSVWPFSGPTQRGRSDGLGRATGPSSTLRNLGLAVLGSAALVPDSAAPDLRPLDG